ncbi:hypothetical protein GJ744_003311 [Endocarpon pusillum]|uniref:Uncharacterized protein n=1 Tax=Endocarpon pusillum TaxID=364733 RepID=A0A8H7DYA4_9EURO|nr:hypothetical protein GJ744_003311 [Endocarpon pusillum]
MQRGSSRTSEQTPQRALHPPPRISCQQPARSTNAVPSTGRAAIANSHIAGEPSADSPSRKRRREWPTEAGGAQTVSSSLPPGPCSSSSAPASGSLVGVLTRPSVGQHVQTRPPTGPFLPAPGATTGPPTTKSTETQPHAGTLPNALAGQQSAAGLLADSSQMPLETTAPSSRVVSRYPKRKIRLGLETEFYIAARCEKHHSDDRREFIRILADKYNRKIAGRHRSMQRHMLTESFSQGYNGRDRYGREWTFVHEEGFYFRTGKFWQLKMLSPVFDIVPGSDWQQHVQALWSYLTKHYQIRYGSDCRNGIYVSLHPECNLPELKRVISSVFHFEPAIEALLPENRLDAWCAKSNWLYHELTAPEAMSRHDFLLDIQEAGDKRTLVDKVQDISHGDTCEFCWNFSGLQGNDSYQHGRMINFRKPPAGPSEPASTFRWAQFTITFILAAIQYGSPDNLTSLSHNIGELRSFMSHAALPEEVGDFHLIDMLWKGKDPKAAREPTMDKSHLDDPDRKWELGVNLKRLVQEDAVECQATIPQGFWNYLRGFDPTA